MREDEFDPAKHITFPELQHIIRQGESPPKDKALVLFTFFKAHLQPSQDDLILKNTSPHKRITPMTKEQAQNLKIGDKIRLTDPLTVIDPKGVDEKILAQTQEGHLVFVEPQETQLADPSPSEASHDEATAQAGKYDPCRLFRVGDIVTPCQDKGRWGGTYWKDRSGMRFIVTIGENEDGGMWVLDPESQRHKNVVAVFFQLVTPVEEMEPYSVVDTLPITTAKPSATA